jgi:O-antigen/teichoic acid export membrane protein
MLNLKEIIDHHISQKVIKVFLIQVIGILCVLISNFWIAKLLSVSDYGKYSFVVSVINLLSLAACLGFSISLVREVASYQAQGKMNLAKGIFRFSFWSTLLVSVIISFLFVFLSYFKYLKLGYEFYITVLIGLSIIFSSLILIRQFSLQGLHLTVASQVVNNIGKYLVQIIAIFCLLNFGLSVINFNSIILVNAIAILVSFVILEIIFYSDTSSILKNSIPVYDYKVWIVSSFSLFIYKFVSTYLASSEIVLLELLRSNEEVGVYSLARKISGFVSFGLMAANIVLAPKISALYAAGSIAEIENLVRKSIRIVFLFSILVFIIIAIVAIPIFNYLGNEYLKSFIPLLVMMLGELINVAFGPVANLLINSHNERSINSIMIYVTVINIILNIIMIQYFGYIGAAITTAATTILWNAWMAIIVKKKVGIKSWI